MPFVFPTHLFNPTSFKPTKGRRVISGGRSLADVDDVVETDAGGYWTWTLAGISLYTPRLLKLWDAWDTHLGGGAVECWLPVGSVETSPRPSAGWGRMTPSNLVWDGDEFFPTDVRRASPYIVARATAATAMGATSLSLEITQGARVTGGERFSVQHPSGPGLYAIERVLVANGQAATVKFWPPMRADVGNNTPLNFDWPMMRARLQPSFDMAGEIENGRMATVQATFVEATDA
jgi:hypothetical protein